MKAKVIIGVFFVGLLLMAIFELTLIWLFAKVVGLPMFAFGWINVILGLLSISVGSMLILWSVWVQFAIGKGTPAPMAATQKLVVNGPYAYSRNPMTLGAAALYLGISIWCGSFIVFLLVLLVFAALLTYIYIHETRELSDRFGVEYRAYKKKTPFLIPFFHLKRRL
jgi:protein-S-isoprenylcysteine O-methyltransferase Ste14